MKRIFLASSIDITAERIAKDISEKPSSLKMAFISTASEPERGDKNWLDSDKEGLKKAGFNLFDYTITGKNYEEIEKDLKDVDVVHVNGGNTFYLLLQAKKSGFDKWVRKAVNSGKIYTGSSAGSIVASPNIEIARKLETKIFEDELGNFDAFNLVDFIVLPHWGNKSFRDLYLHHRLDFAYKPENKIILLNDWQYVRVEDKGIKIIDIRDNYASEY